MIDIPIGVVDKESYLKYLELKKITYDDEARMYDTSIVGLTIDLMSPTNVLRRQMQDLPQEEQTKIAELSLERRKRSGLLASLKKKAFKGHKLNLKEVDAVLAPRRTEILELFGKFYNATEVHKIVSKDWGYTITFQAILAFQQQQIDRITELQDIYKKTYQSVRLSHKRSRLEELTTLYGHRKEIYETSRGREDYKLLLLTIRQIREEVEGNKLAIDIKGDIQVENVLSLHTNEILGNMLINNLIISRVAAKTNVNEQYLSNLLHRSFYSKFAGFEQLEETEEVQYPSSIVYDFDEIKSKNNQRKQEKNEATTVPFEEIPDKPIDINTLSREVIIEEGDNEATDIRKKLLRMIKSKNVEMSQVTDRINRIEEKPELNKKGKRRSGVKGLTDHKKE